MARHVETTLIDDLDGSNAERTVTLGLDGKDYEIDLSSANLARLTDTLGEFLGAARRAGRAASGKAASGGQSAGDREENARIREWARGNGFTIGDRGRIPTSLVESYRESAGQPA